MPLDPTYLRASDGTGDASLMHITANRITGSTTIIVDTVVGVPQKFIGTSGTLSSSGFIDPSTVKNFYGHLDTGHLVIDGFITGSTDTGNTIGQVVVIKPSSAWANEVADSIANFEVDVSPNILINGDFINNSDNGYGTTPNDWSATSANQVQGGFPTLTKQNVLDILGLVDANVKGLWPLNGDFIDLSASNYNLTASGSPTDSSDGLMAQAKAFVAASSQFASSTAPNVLATGNQTWIAWYKPTTTGAEQRILGHNDSAGSNKGGLLVLSNTFPQFIATGLTTNTSVTSTIPMVAGKWHMLVGVYDSTNSLLKIWCNGVKTQVTASGSHTFSGTQTVAVGRLGAENANYANGLIQGAMMLGVALTDSQVKRLWAATSYKGIKVRRAGTDGYVSHTVNQEKLVRLRGKTLTLRAAAFQSVASTAQIAVYDGTTETLATASLSTGAQFDQSVSVLIPATATEITVRLKVLTTNGSVWYKEVGLYEGAVPLSFQHAPEDQIRFPHLIAQNPNPFTISPAQFSTTSTSFVDVPGFTLPLDLDRISDVRIVLDLRYQNSVAARPVQIKILCDGAQIGNSGGLPVPGSGFGYVGCLICDDFQRAVGHHDYKIQISTDGSNADTVLILGGSRMTIEPDTSGRVR